MRRILLVLVVALLHVSIARAQTAPSVPDPSSDPVLLRIVQDVTRGHHDGDRGVSGELAVVEHRRVFGRVDREPAL